MTFYTFIIHVVDETPFEAVNQGDLSTLRALLKDGSLSLHNEGGKIMLYNAAMCGHYRICSFLLNKGCPVNSRGTNALHAAAMSGDIRIIHLLFEHGLDVNAVDNMD